MDLISIYSDQTCGANCWLANEPICKCSCSGKNHGIALTGQNPEKLIKIDGFRYKLFEAGQYNQLYWKAMELLKDSIKNVLTLNGHTYNYKWGATDKGSPFRLKSANNSQKEWIEVRNLGLRFPYLLWQKVV